MKKLCTFIVYSSVGSTFPLFGTALFEAVCWRVMERFTPGCALPS